jgi:hypothetical protein
LRDSICNIIKNRKMFKTKGFLMVNKNLLALFIAITTISAISANCYRDGNCDVVERTGEFAGDTVRGSGRVAGDAVRGTGRVAGDTVRGAGGVANRATGGFLGRVFTGKSEEELQADRDARHNRDRYYN